MGITDHQNEKRREMIIIVSNDMRWFHLCDLMQSAGTNECTPTENRVGGKIYDLWFRVSGLLFESVEEVLVYHGIADNLVSLEPTGGKNDAIAVYNEKQNG